MWRIGRWCQTDGAVKLRITSQPSLGFTGTVTKKRNYPVSSASMTSRVRGQTGLETLERPQYLR